MADITMCANYDKGSYLIRTKCYRFTAIASRPQVWAYYEPEKGKACYGYLEVK